MMVFTKLIFFFVLAYSRQHDKLGKCQTIIRLQFSYRNGSIYYFALSINMWNSKISSYFYLFLYIYVLLFFFYLYLRKECCLSMFKNIQTKRKKGNVVSFHLLLLASEFTLLILVKVFSFPQDQKLKKKKFYYISLMFKANKDNG